MAATRSRLKSRSRQAQGESESRKRREAKQRARREEELRKSNPPNVIVDVELEESEKAIHIHYRQKNGRAQTIIFRRNRKGRYIRETGHDIRIEDKRTVRSRVRVGGSGTDKTPGDYRMQIARPINQRADPNKPEDAEYFRREVTKHEYTREQIYEFAENLRTAKPTGIKEDAKPERKGKKTSQQTQKKSSRRRKQVDTRERKKRANVWSALGRDA